MSLLSKAIGSIFKEASDAVDKRITKDVVEATIAGGLLVAAASNGIEDSEIEALETVLGSVDEFQPWKADFQKLISKYAVQIQKTPRLGKMTAMNELADLHGKNPKDAELVFNCILTVADASGAIEDAERTVLLDIAKLLSLDPRKFGL